MEAIAHGFVDLEEFTRSPGIDVMLDAEPLEVAPGETTKVTWAAVGASELRLWHTEQMPAVPEPLDWVGVFDRGEPVATEDELKLTVDRDTAIFVVARVERELRGRRVLVEVRHEPERLEVAEACSPTESLLEKMELVPHMVWPDDLVFDPGRVGSLPVELLHLWSSPPAPPGITISAPKPVIFTDETSSASWNVSATDCVTVGFTQSMTRLVPDPSKPAGSKYDGGGWGSGWSITCSAGKSGSQTFAGQHGPRHAVLHVHASNAAGKSAASSQWIDTLGIPKFEGAATATRQSAIRTSLRKLDVKLREGRLLYDTYLDNTVEAFKQGCLSRQGMWSRMLAELQNLHITPIKCEDTTQTNAAAGTFEESTGRIYLRWKPTKQPNLDYLLCHELAHKAGFNSTMYGCGVAAYNECGADKVASAILGLAPDPCDVK